VTSPEGSSTFETLCGHLATGAIAVSAASLVCLALVESWQVFARYVLNDPPSWTEPVALLFMSTTMMLGAAAGVRSEAHFGFFVAVQLAPPPLRAVLLAISRITATTIGLLLAAWGADLLVENWTFRMAGAPLPQGIVYLPISLGGALVALFSIERLLLRRAPAPVSADAESA
jgi:TRAP-type C4-dicarboxylate transport system permease small subunit